MEKRTISVTGTGRISVAPDYIELTLALKSRGKDYENASAKAETDLALLRRAITESGFDANALKTSSYSVSAEYENEQDAAGRFKRVFKGYACDHSLILGFKLDFDMLSRALGCIAACPAAPALNISFSVKDKDALTARVLKAAALNARERAEALCAASGVKLGLLLSIGSLHGGVLPGSPVAFGTAADGVALRSLNIDLAPKNIVAEESATFVWEIE